jgi:hypothetical protein
MSPASEISPELVLVCPELAARARAAMPDRPWEVFVPRRVEPLLPAPVAVEPAPPVSQPWLRAISLVPAALLVGFATLLLVGSISSFGERPSLAPVSRPPSAGRAPSSGTASTALSWLTQSADRSTQLSRRPATARP